MEKTGTEKTGHRFQQTKSQMKAYQHFETSTKNCFFLRNFFRVLLSANIYVQFQQMRSQMKWYDTHYMF